MEDQVDDAEIDSYIKKPGETDESAAGGDPEREDDVDEDDGEESDPNAFEVETIKAVRKGKGKNKYEYKVSWKGYGTDDDTWEPRENLLCDELLKAFESSEEGKRMFAECQKPASASTKRSSAATSSKNSSRPAGRGQTKSATRASTPDFDDDGGSEDNWSGSKKRKSAGGGAASKPAVRRRHTALSDDDDDEPRIGRGRGGGKAAKTSDENLTSAPGGGIKNRLPIDKTTHDFLKNDEKNGVESIRGYVPAKEKLDDTDYDAVSRVSVAAVKQRNTTAKPTNSAETRDYGLEWKQKTTAEGVKSGYVLKSIIAMILHGSELTYLVDWKNSKNIDLVQHSFLAEFYPREVFDFIIDRTEVQSEEMLNLMEEKETAADEKANESSDIINKNDAEELPNEIEADELNVEAAPAMEDADETDQQQQADVADEVHVANRVEDAEEEELGTTNGHAALAELFDDYDDE